MLEGESRRFWLALTTGAGLGVWALSPTQGLVVELLGAAATPVGVVVGLILAVSTLWQARKWSSTIADPKRREHAWAVFLPLVLLFFAKLVLPDF